MSSISKYSSNGYSTNDGLDIYSVNPGITRRSSLGEEFVNYRKTFYEELEPSLLDEVKESLVDAKKKNEERLAEKFNRVKAIAERHRDRLKDRHTETDVMMYNYYRGWVDALEWLLKNRA